MTHGCAKVRVRVMDSIPNDAKQLEDTRMLESMAMRPRDCETCAAWIRMGSPDDISDDETQPENAQMRG